MIRKIIISLFMCFTNSVPDTKQFMTELARQETEYLKGISYESRINPQNNHPSLWITIPLGNENTLYIHYPIKDPNKSGNLTWWYLLDKLVVDSDTNVFLQKSGCEKLIFINTLQESDTGIQFTSTNTNNNMLVFTINAQSILKIIHFVYLNKQTLNQIISNYTPKRHNLESPDTISYSITPIRLAHPFYALVSNPSDELLGQIKQLRSSIETGLLRQLNHQKSDQKYRFRTKLTNTRDLNMAIAEFLYGTQDEFKLLSQPKLPDYQDQNNWRTLDKFARKLLKIYQHSCIQNQNPDNTLYQ